MHTPAPLRPLRRQQLIIPAAGFRALRTGYKCNKCPGQMDLPAIVIDNGSKSYKAGFAGDEHPRLVLSSLVSHLKPQRPHDAFICHDAQYQRDVAHQVHPIENGLVTNWDAMEQMWNHIFKKELRISPSERPILVTEVALNPKSDREKMTEVLFEKFRSPAMFASISGLLALYEAGRTTGLVLDIGHEIASVIPVYEGYAISSAIQKSEIAGKRLTALMSSLVWDRCPHHRIPDAVAEKIKHKNCYVAFKYEDEMRNSSAGGDVKCMISDRDSLLIGNERFRCPEALFRPGIIWKTCPGVQEMIFEAIAACDKDLWECMYANIILTGGSTLFSGISMRLHREMRLLAPKARKIRVNAPKERKWSGWIGGSVMASQPTFDPMCITRQEYEENGPAIVHRKCF